MSLQLTNKGAYSVVMSSFKSFYLKMLLKFGCFSQNNSVLMIQN